MDIATASLAKDKWRGMLSGGLSAMTSFSEMVAPDIDYDVLQLTASQKELQADNLELQVEQQANLLREQFLEAVGTAQYGAARRGVKLGEGDIQKDIEQSSGEVGKDIQTARDTAEYKAGSLRRGAKRLKSASKIQAEYSHYGRIGSFGGGLTGLSKAFGG